MAVGEAAGAAEGPRPVVSSSRRPRAAAAEAEAAPAPAPAPAEQAAVEEPAPLVKEADPEFERLLAEEEAIEATLKDSKGGDTPHFRPGDGD